MSGPLRLLSIPVGEVCDPHGYELGEDWMLVAIGEDDDASQHYLTTKRVHASEYATIVPGTNRGLGRMLAHAVNELWQRDRERWPELLAEWSRGEPPPPPRELKRCAECGELIEGGLASTLSKDGWIHRHSACMDWSALAAADDDTPGDAP